VYTLQTKLRRRATSGFRMEIISEDAAEKRRTLPTQGCSGVGGRFIFNLILAAKKCVNGLCVSIFGNQCKTCACTPDAGNWTQWERCSILLVEPTCATSPKFGMILGNGGG